MSEGRDVYADRLSAMKSGFSIAKKQAKIMGGEEAFPEGIFVGRVTAKLKESKTSGCLMVSRRFAVADGEMAGMSCFDNLIIDHTNEEVSARGRRDLCRFLDLCEIDSTQVEDDPGQLPALLETLTEDAPYVKFSTKHSTSGERTFINVSVLELIEHGNAFGGTTPEPEPQPVDTPAEVPADEDTSEKDEREEKEVEDEAEVEDDPMENALREFCNAHDIAFEAEDDLDQVKERIAEQTYPEAELTADEITLLRDADLGRLIIPAPRRTVSKVTPKTAPKAEPKKVVAPAKKRR